MLRFDGQKKGGLSLLVITVPGLGRFSLPGAVLYQRVMPAGARVSGGFPPSVPSRRGFSLPDAVTAVFPARRTPDRLSLIW